jgi:actin-related protein 3
MARQLAAVIDNGTGYTKMGYVLIHCLPPERGLITSLPSRFAGNDSPSFVFPTAIATRQAPGGTSNRPPPPAKPGFLSSSTAGPGGGHLAQKRGTEDLDFFIGDEAIQANAGAGYGIDYPIKHGIISDWSLMER